MFPGTQQRPVHNLSFGKPEQILPGTQGTAPTEDKLRCEMGRAHKDTHRGGRESVGKPQKPWRDLNTGQTQLAKLSGKE